MEPDQIICLCLDLTLSCNCLKPICIALSYSVYLLSSTDDLTAADRELTASAAAVHKSQGKNRMCMLSLVMMLICMTLLHSIYF